MPGECPVCGKTLWIEPSDPAGDAPCPRCGRLLWFPSSIVGSELDAPDCEAIISLRSTTRDEAFDEIISALVHRNLISGSIAPRITKAIQRREELGSTGIGNGFALPHAKDASVDRFVIAMATSEHEIEYNALDGQPVHPCFC